MLAPEFAMLPAVYAQDETPALTQTVDIAEDAEAPAATEAADLSAGNGEAAAADPESGDLPSDAGLEPEDQAKTRQPATHPALPWKPATIQKLPAKMKP